MLGLLFNVRLNFVRIEHFLVDNYLKNCPHCVQAESLLLILIIIILIHFCFMFSGRQTASLERNAKVNFTRETLGHETNKHNENARIEKSDLFPHFIYTYSSKLLM